MNQHRRIIMLYAGKKLKQGYQNKVKWLP